MSERLRELLHAEPTAEERESEERALRIVRAAHAESAPPRRRPLSARGAAALAAGVAAAAVALTPAGAAVGGWVEDVLRDEPAPARPALRLPAPGRMLVDSDRGSWVLSRDGSRRLLGRFDESSWSPRGLFVVATRGRELVALEPDGDLRWSLTAPARASAARWSPSGFRIAYRAGASLRVVAGDGTADRELLARAGAAPVAWRPGTAHLVAAADPRGRVLLLDADSGRRLWRSPPGERPRRLDWSADGSRLIAVAPGATRVFSPGGRLVADLGGGLDAAFERRGHGFALTRPTPGGTEVVLVQASRGPGAPRVMFSAPGAVSGVEWSPDGRWLLVEWRSADQWVLVRGRRVRSATAVSDRFDPAGLRRGAFPRVAGWCC